MKHRPEGECKGFGALSCGLKGDLSPHLLRTLRDFSTGWWGDVEAMAVWEEEDKRVDSLGVGPAQGGGSHTAALALSKA